ncbi:MAG: sugar ABC transporter substrate-binding protein [Microbacteriaceae bacterium]
MKFKKIAGIALVIGATALALSGCSGTSGSSDSSTASDISIGLVAFDMTNSTTNNIWQGMQEQAKADGIQTTMIDSAGSPDKAIAAIQTLVQKHVSVIFTQVFPPAAMASGIAAAQAAGIPIASLGGGTGDGVQSNWDDGTGPGKASGEAVLKLTDGKGALLKLGFKPGVPCLMREAGFDEAINGKNSFTITRQEIQFPGQVEISQKYTAAWLTSNAAGSADHFTVWACTDDAAVGAAAAVQAAGRTDVNIVTIDGTPEAIKGIQNGTITAAVWIDGYGTGQEAVQKVPDIIKQGVSGGPTQYQAKFTLVDKSTLDAFLKENPSALG